MSKLSSSELVLAAVSSSAPKGVDESSDDYQVRISEQAFNLSMMVGERSPVVRLLDTIQGEGENDTKVFTGIIESVKRHKPSTRAIVSLAPTDRNEEGEIVRTDRTDNAQGLAIAKKARSLVGHRVVLFVEMEPFDGGRKKLRVLRQLHDLGPASSEDD